MQASESDLDDVVAALQKAAVDMDRVVKAVEKQKGRVECMECKSPFLVKLLKDTICHHHVAHYHNRAIINCMCSHFAMEECSLST